MGEWGSCQHGADTCELVTSAGMVAEAVGMVTVAVVVVEAEEVVLVSRRQRFHSTSMSPWISRARTMMHRMEADAQRIHQTCSH